MKSFKNIFYLAAFVLAVTTSFAFTPVKATKLGLINVKAKTLCTQPHQVSDQCTSTSSGQLCKVQIGFQQYNVIPLNADCEALPLRNPNL